MKIILQKICLVSAILLSTIFSACGTETESTDSVPVLVSTDIKYPWSYSFDLSDSTGYFFDSPFKIEYCSNEQFFCVSEPMQFSLPLSIIKKYDEEWRIGDVTFTLRKSSKMSPCFDEGDLYEIYAHDIKSNIETNYLYSTDLGIVLMNRVISGKPEEKSPLFSWVNCKGDVFSLDQINNMK